MKPLYKTTVIIWSEYDPSGLIELDELGRDAMDGDSYCSKRTTIHVEDPSKDKDAPDTEFFGVDEDDDDEEEDDDSDED